MNTLTDLLAFILSVASQWQALVTGSFLTAVVFAVERWRAAELPRRTIVGVFIWTYLPLAAFLAWRYERTKFDRLEALTSDAQALTLDQEKRLREVLLQGKGSSVSLAILSTDKRGREFAQRIQSAFSESGWGVGSGGGSSSGSGRSLRILADGGSLNSKAESLIQTAFHAANLRYRLFRVCQGTPFAIEIGEAAIERGEPEYEADQR